MSNVYEENGYADREDYLESLAEENGLEVETVKMIADLLGEDEDFDGLVNSVEDYGMGL